MVETRRSPQGARLRTGPLVWLTFMVAGVASLSVSVVGVNASGGRDTRSEPIRIVLSSTGATSSAGTLSTATLYAKHDPWKRYLASERVCPGGERTDRPLQIQVRTVACLVNFARKQRGLRQLSFVRRLDVASASKAQAIQRCGSFAHDPCGGGWETSITSTGYMGAFGENLYLASGSFAAPRPTVDAWLNSAPHRENLFGPRWRAQGLAVVLLGRFSGYDNVAVWVNVLGDRGA